MSAVVRNEGSSRPAGPGATTRLREAPRLDLEDEQKSLIEDLYHRARRLLARVRVPDEVEASLARPDLDDETTRGMGLLCDETDRLRRVNRALEKLCLGVYGRCERCAVDMDLHLLAEDTTRVLCPECSAGEAHRV